MDRNENEFENTRIKERKKESYSRMYTCSKLSTHHLFSRLMASRAG